MNKLTASDIERLREILAEIKKHVAEAKDIIRRGPKITWERAKGYCLGHIEIALDNDHHYLSSDTNLAEIIDELETSVDATACPKCGSFLDEDGYCHDCPYCAEDTSEGVPA